MHSLKRPTPYHVFVAHILSPFLAIGFIQTLAVYLAPHFFDSVDIGVVPALTLTFLTFLGIIISVTFIQSYVGSSFHVLFAVRASILILIPSFFYLWLVPYFLIHRFGPPWAWTAVPVLTAVTVVIWSVSSGAPRIYLGKQNHLARVAREREISLLAEQQRAEQERLLAIQNAENARLEALKRAEIERRTRAEEQRMEEERRRVEAAHRTQAEKERIERERFLRAERLHRCTNDSMVFPKESLPVCPMCGNKDVEQFIVEDRATPRDPGLHSSNGNGHHGNALAKVEHEIAERRDFCDYIGIGNTIVEYLMRPGQWQSPDEHSLFFAEQVREIVAQKFDIPAQLAYEEPHRDLYVDAADRNSWTSSTFIQTLILAYTLGATWKTLPEPFRKLVPFFQLMAQRQAAAINIVKASSRGQFRRFDPADL